MDIYENIIIGNFLYSFGAAMGARSHVKELPLSVNLLQQTPLDRPGKKTGGRLCVKIDPNFGDQWRGISNSCKKASCSNRIR